MDSNFITKQLLRKQNEIWDEFDSVNPRELLHYTCRNGFRSILSSGEIWCTDIKDVNDPREGDYGLEVIQTVVAGSRKRLDEEFAETLMQSPSLFGLKRSWSLYVACFSAREQPYMWKNYACEHTGFAIGFDHDRIISGAMGGKKYALFRMLYDRPTQEQHIETTLDHAIAMELTLNLPPAERRRFWMERVAVALIVCASRFKASKWSREEEFRISITDPPDAVKFDSGGKSRIRISFVRSAVARVTRGTKCAADLDTVTVRDLLNRHGYGADVQVVDAQF